MNEEQTQPEEQPKQQRYKWIYAQHGEGTSNVLVKVPVEDEEE